jgi:hypothetical protein
MEAKLKALEDERCSHQQKAKEQALAIRYHKVGASTDHGTLCVADKLKKLHLFLSSSLQVKFFERQKAVKALSRIERDLACATGEETDKLQASLQRAREDLLYIKFFPKNEKYIALFGSRSGGEDASPDVLERQRKCRMRAVSTNCDWRRIIRGGTNLSLSSSLLPSPSLQMPLQPATVIWP